VFASICLDGQFLDVRTFRGGKAEVVLFGGAEIRLLSGVDSAEHVGLKLGEESTWYCLPQGCFSLDPQTRVGCCQLPQQRGGLSAETMKQHMVGDSQVPSRGRLAREYVGVVVKEVHVDRLESRVQEGLVNAVSAEVNFCAQSRVVYVECSHLLHSL